MTQNGSTKNNITPKKLGDKNKAEFILSRLLILCGLYFNSPFFVCCFGMLTPPIQYLLSLPVKD